MLGFGFGFRPTSDPAASMENSAAPLGPDEDIPASGQQFAQFGAGCFWGVELASSYLILHEPAAKNQPMVFR